MPRSYFGTDGIRGQVGQSPMTPDFVLHLGWAIGRVLGRDRQDPKILIGKDTRLSGYLFESVLEAGLSAAGVDILLSGPQPTPAIAYLTRTLSAQAGIVISASHNPYPDNGIKLFDDQGCKLAEKVEEEIEAMLTQPIEICKDVPLGKARRVQSPNTLYREFCRSTVPAGFGLAGRKLLIDCAHGATYRVAPKLFADLGADVIAVANKPNGVNINEGCGATYPQFAQNQCKQHQAGLGFAFDGDGDRLMMIDEAGEIADGDDLLYVLARAQQKQGRLSGGVVGTQMSNLGLEQALGKLGIPFERAAVGDRYVQECLNTNDWSLGGETSGHLICHTHVGDALIAALQVLHALDGLDETLVQARAGLRKYPQVTVNVHWPYGRTPSSRVTDAVDQAQIELGDAGRVFLRPSGTEPLLRITAEGEDAKRVHALAQSVAQVAEQQSA